MAEPVGPKLSDDAAYPSSNSSDGLAGTGKLGCSYCTEIDSASALTVKPPRELSAPAGPSDRATANSPEPPVTKSAEDAPSTTSRRRRNGTLMRRHLRDRRRPGRRATRDR